MSRGVPGGFSLPFRRFRHGVWGVGEIRPGGRNTRTSPSFSMLADFPSRHPPASIRTLGVNSSPPPSPNFEISRFQEFTFELDFCGGLGRTEVRVGGQKGRHMHMISQTPAPVDSPSPSLGFPSQGNLAPQSSDHSRRGGPDPGRPARPQ